VKSTDYEAPHYSNLLHPTATSSPLGTNYSLQHLPHLYKTTGQIILLVYFIVWSFRKVIGKQNILNRIVIIITQTPLILISVSLSFVIVPAFQLCYIFKWFLAVFISWFSPPFWWWNRHFPCKLGTFRKRIKNVRKGFYFNVYLYLLFFQYSSCTSPLHIVISYFMILCVYTYVDATATGRKPNCIKIYNNNNNSFLASNRLPVFVSLWY
jgi:hypothetical protein